MSWARGWYGWDPESEDAAAWGPNETADDARCHPDAFAPDTAEVKVFYIAVSETPPHRHWANEVKQRGIWVEGPESEASRACVRPSYVEQAEHRFFDPLVSRRKAAPDSFSAAYGCTALGDATVSDGDVVDDFGCDRFGEEAWGGLVVNVHTNVLALCHRWVDREGNEHDEELEIGPNTAPRCTAVMSILHRVQKGHR